MSNITLFSQIISKLDRGKFSKLVKDKQSDKHSKGFNSWTHLVSMLFCQFARSQSVRDISNGLRSATGNLNHLGIGKAPSKSTISYQNKHRPWGLFKEYYFSLLESLGQQARFKQVKFRIKSKIFLLDSTTIGLCGPKPMMFCNGSRDGLFPVESIKEAFSKMRQVWDSQKAGDKLVTNLYDAPHEFNLKMQTDSFLWLDKIMKKQ